MRVIKRLLWLVTVVASIIGSLVILLTLSSGNSAPQEAAGYSMACALAVVPYVLARSVESFNRELADEPKKDAVTTLGL